MKQCFRKLTLNTFDHTQSLLPLDSLGSGFQQVSQIHGGAVPSMSEDMANEAIQVAGIDLVKDPVLVVLQGSADLRGKALHFELHTVLLNHAQEDFPQLLRQPDRAFIRRSPLLDFHSNGPRPQRFSNNCFPERK